LVGAAGRAAGRLTRSCRRALLLELLLLGRALERDGGGLRALDGLGDGVEVAGADLALVLDRGEAALGGANSASCSSTNALICRRA